MNSLNQMSQQKRVDQKEQLEILETAALLVGLKKHNIYAFRSLKALLNAIVNPK